MKYFNDYSIKRKLVLLLVALVTFTLLLQGSILVYTDIKNLKTNIVESLSVLASAIGSMSRAAILFEDARAGSRILSSLEGERQIDLAVIYKADNQVFVTYLRDKKAKIESPTLDQEGELITEKGIEIIRDIVLDGEVLGKIYIKANLSEMESKIENHLVLVVGIFFIILLISIPLSFIISWIVNYKILNKIGEFFNVSTKYGDENLYSYYLNTNEIDWIYIRDVDNNLTYQGRVFSFSENSNIQEIVLYDVTVYRYEDSAELYHVPTIYLAKKSGSFRIEAVPQEYLKEEKNEEKTIN